jgi:hypothetical protein
LTGINGSASAIVGLLLNSFLCFNFLARREDLFEAMTMSYYSSESLSQP